MKKMTKEETLKSVQDLRSAFKLVNKLFDNYFEEIKMKKTNNLLTEICSLTLFCIALPAVGIFIVVASVLTLFTIPVIITYSYLKQLYLIYFLKRKLL